MESWEKTFVRSHLETLASLPVLYPNNYEQPPSNWLKKVHTFPVDLPAPPSRDVQEETNLTVPMKLTLKSSKPIASFIVQVLSTDTIASLKQSLASQTGAPPADVQRLLLKGKVLADSKLVKEYAIADGDTINIMTKPGYLWDSSSATGASSFKAPAPPASPSLAVPSPMEGVERTSPASSPRTTHSRSHSRVHSRNPSAANIPDLTLSPTPVPGTGANTPTGSPSKPVLSIPLTLDTSAATSTSASQSSITSYQSTISKPEFWDKLYVFLKDQFGSGDDAATAFEEFLLASKSHLSPHDIAKIRDVVGIFGMAGH